MNDHEREVAMEELDNLRASRREARQEVESAKRRVTELDDQIRDVLDRFPEYRYSDPTWFYSD